MKKLLPEQIEEYKQVDARIIFLIGQANRYMSSLFAAYVGFWIWMANRKNPMEIISAAMILSMILFLGIILLDIHGRSISKARAYKLVFFEKYCGNLHYESSKLKNMNNWTVDRLRSYGLLGVFLNIWGMALLFIDPTKSFSIISNNDFLFTSIFFLPGIIYSVVILFRKNRFLEYTNRWEKYKKTLNKDVNRITEQSH